MGIKVTKAAGLYTSDNPYGAVPEGSFAQADNVVIRARDVVEPRRGGENLTYTFGSGSDRASEVAFFGTTPIVHTSVNALARDTGSAFTPYSGTYTPPDATTLRMKFAEARQRLYFTTTAGIKVLPSTTSAVEAAGVQRPFELIYNISGEFSGLSGDPDGTGAWFPKNSSIAYAMTIGRKASDGFIKWSAPTGRLIIVNPADATVNLARVSNVVTATVTASGTHGFKVGDKINITPGGAGALGHTFGTGGSSGFTITAVTSTTFTYAETATDDTLAAQTATSKSKKTTFSPRINSDVTSGDLIRLWRTEITTGATVDPGDELFLFYEAPLTAAHGSSGVYVYPTAGTGAFIDSTPAEFVSNEPLYTNPATGDGIGQANFQPPIAEDITYWNDRMWFGNTKNKHRFELRLLGVGSPDGIQNNDTIVIGDWTYTATTSLPTSGTSFAVITGLSASKNVRDVSNSLLRATISNAPPIGAGTNFRVYYLSGENDPPGRLVIEESGIGGSAGYFAASRPASWAPNLPTNYTINAGSLTRSGSTVTATTTASHGFAVGQVVYVHANVPDANYANGLKTILTENGTNQFTYDEANADVTASATAYNVSATTVSTDAETRPNRLYYSKLQQPEAVPLLNYLDVGAANAAILRVTPLGDRLYVWKEDGLFAVTGEYPFRVDAVDLTVKLFAPDSVASVANRLIAFTTQGFVSVAGGAVGIISRPIENVLQPLITNAVAGFKSAVFGLGYETERSYLCWMPVTADATTCTQAYIYNVLTNTWTRRTDTRGCGRVAPTDLLYLGSTTTNTLVKERKVFGAADYSDESSDVTITTGGTTSIITTPALSVGDYIIKSSARAVVTAVDAGTGTATITRESGSTSFTTGTATKYPAFQCTVVYNPNTAGEPGVSKQFQEVCLLFGRTDFELGYITTSNTDPNATFGSDSTAVSNLIVLGNTGLPPGVARLLIPLEQQRNTRLSVGFSILESRAVWRLYGYSLEAVLGSGRVAR